MNSGRKIYLSDNNSVAGLKADSLFLVKLVSREILEYWESRAIQGSGE
jgi:hypothetical protein